MTMESEYGCPFDPDMIDLNIIIWGEPITLDGDTEAVWPVSDCEGAVLAYCPCRASAEWVRDALQEKAEKRE